MECCKLIEGNLFHVKFRGSLDTETCTNHLKVITLILETNSVAFGVIIDTAKGSTVYNTDVLSQEVIKSLSYLRTWRGGYLTRITLFVGGLWLSRLLLQSKIQGKKGMGWKRLSWLRNTRQLRIFWQSSMRLWILWFGTSTQEFAPPRLKKKIQWKDKLATVLRFVVPVLDLGLGRYQITLITFYVSYQVIS